MADGKLVFPVEFDLENAVTKASGDAERALRRLETMINSRPLKLGIEIEKPKGDWNFGEGSVKATREEMKKLVEEWNKLSEAERITNQQTGEFTDKAKQILQRYSELVTATETYARSLEQIASAAKKSADAELKANQKAQAEIDKRIAKSKELVAMLTNEDKSVESLTARLKFYTQQMNSSEKGSAKWAYNSQMVQQLKEQLDQLNITQKKVTDNDVKQTEKRLQERARIKTALMQEENSIDKVNAKIGIWQNIMNRSTEGGSQFDYASRELGRLGEVLDQLKAKSAEASKTEAELRAERAAAAREEIENQRRVKAERAQANSETERIRSARAAQIAQKRQEIALLNGEEKSIAQVSEKLRIRQEIARKATDTSSAGYQRNAAEIIRLTELLDTLNRKQREATTKAIPLMPENSINDLTAKIQAYRNIMQNSDFGSKEFKDAMNAASALTTQLEQMNKVVADVEKMRQFRQALKEACDTLEGLNARLSAWQSKIQGEKFGSDGWNAAAHYIAKYSRELEIANQYLQDFQQKAFQGLGENWTKTKVEEVQKYREQIRLLSEQFNILNAQGLAYDSNGNLTAKANNILKQRAGETKKLADTLRTVDDAQKQYNDDLRKAEEEQKKAAEATRRAYEQWKATRQMLQSNEERLVNLNAKLQFYQSLIQKQQVGSDAWNKTALEIRRLSEELERANQRMRDFQQTAFKGLGDAMTQQQVEKLMQLRLQLESIDRQINQRYQSGNAYVGGDSKNGFTGEMNALLKSRMNTTREINNMLKSGYDLQIEREQQINKLIEQRKAKHQAELDALKQKRIANDKIRTALAGQENTIKNITQKLQIQQARLQSTDIDSKKFERIAKEVERLTEKLDKAQKKMAELTGQSTSGTSRQAENARRVNQEYSKQLTYLDRLVRRMALYTSVGMIGGFLTKVREITAQFELQKVSLGAILQDQTKANQLFSEIKSFALKSPVSILDLTKYTKQLAAYKIGYDELFETTKKLTDVSVGLGVSMDRVVLAYGQVRATGHLRASEIRQFTEMGVPIVEELAAKLSKMNGELVSAADVMDMVSKRAISFEMVKEVFDDMTSAGGIFYNMQEKQGNTLYGLWAKLGDAASVMYDEIGRTGWINDSMKGIIQSLTDLMKNWKMAGSELAVLTLGFGAYKLSSSLATVNTIAASKATRDYARAQIELNAAQKSGHSWNIAAAEYASRAARANRVAAMSTNMWTAAKWKLVAATNTLKSALVGNWITLLITALVAVGAAIYNTIQNANKLKNALAEIKSETSVLQGQSVRNFERLVKEATASADGSKKQKEALDELNRTYKDMLPSEALKIENLRNMRGKYEQLTEAVREYIAVQQQEKAINTINEEEGAIQTKMQKKLRDAFKDQDLSTDEITLFFRAFEKEALDTSKTVKEQFVAAMKTAGIEGAENIWREVATVADNWGNANPLVSWFGGGAARDAFGESNSALKALSESIARQNDLIESQSKQYDELTQDLGEYNKAMRQYKEWVDNSMNSGETMLQNQENVNTQIRYMASTLQDEMKKAGVGWKDEWMNIVMAVDPKDLNNLSALNMEAIISAIDPNQYPELYKFIEAFKKMYEGLVPSNPIAKAVRSKFFEIAQSMKDSGEAMRQHLWDGKRDLKEHIKSLSDAVDRIRDNVYKYSQYIKNFGLVGKLALQAMGIDVDAMTAQADAIEKLMEYEKTYIRETDSGKGRGGHKQDPRLQNLKEEISLVQKLYQEYKQLEKQEGEGKATADMNRMAKDTIAMLSKKYNIGLPKTATDVVTALEILYGKMAQLPKKVFPSLDKDLKELRWTIEKVDIDDSQANIEKALKELADKISKTKTAKEFYDKILSQTGDVDLAANVTLSIYGETGKELFERTVEQIREVFKSGKPGVEIDLSGVIDMENERINYGKLEEIFNQYQDAIVEKNRDTCQKIISEGQKTAAANVLTWEKELAKAKDFEQQRTDIITKHAERRAEIIKSNAYKPEEKEERIKLSYEQQGKELADLNIKEFKGSDEFIEMFENLEDKATSSLRHMRKEIQKVIDTDKNMSPENMKAMVDALEKVDGILLDRNPFANMKEGLKGMFDSNARLKQARANTKTAQAEYDAQEPELDAEIEAAMQERIAAEWALLELQEQEIANKDELVAAELRLNNANANVDKAEQKKLNAQNKVKKAKKEENKAQNDSVKSQNKFIKGVNQAKEATEKVRSVLEGLEPLFGDLTSDATTLGDVFNAMVNAMSTFTTIMELVIVLQEAFNIASESNPWMAIAAAVLAVTAALAGFVSAQKVKEANKVIEEQQSLLDNLEYTYDRLEKTASKLFGSDYISNWNKQLKTLEAERQAKLKQAEAEKNKGKKEDEEKTKQYYEDARDLADQIADMQAELVEHFAGSSRADIARQMAQSWIDARASMSDTFDAIKGDYQDMIKNMIVEGAAARVIENALTPMWDAMEEELKNNDPVAAIEKAMSMMDSTLNMANNGMEVLWKSFEAYGFDMKKILGDSDSEYKGIAKSVAGASSEEINNVAAIGNTLMYYVSPIPLISDNVAVIRQLLQGNASVSVGGTTVNGVDYTDMLTTANQHLANLPLVEQHLSNIYTLLNRLVITKGGTFGVNSFLKQ